jgi:hypothetical protein
MLLLHLFFGCAHYLLRGKHLGVVLDALDSHVVVSHSNVLVDEINVFISVLFEVLWFEIEVLDGFFAEVVVDFVTALLRFFFAHFGVHEASETVVNVFISILGPFIHNWDVSEVRVTVCFPDELNFVKLKLVLDSDVSFFLHLLSCCQLIRPLRRSGGVILHI